MNLISVKKINDRLYMLNENITESVSMTLMLVVGEERAAIIDTGFGLSGDLDQVIRKITDKPVICLLTHSDPDHAGGAPLFEEIYMSNKEQELLDNGSINPMVRFQTAKAMMKDTATIQYVKKHMVKAKTFSYKNIEDGDRFDLGGCTLEAIAFPGHTVGSMCFYNKEENYCLVGDAVANGNSPVLVFDKCLPLATYQKNLLKFAEHVGESCVLYAGHNNESLPKNMISEILILCDEILAGKTEDDKPYLPIFMLPPGKDEPIMKKIVGTVKNKIITKKIIGKAVPMEHKHREFKTSIKYNAKKIH